MRWPRKASQPKSSFPTPSPTQPKSDDKSNSFDYDEVDTARVYGNPFPLKKSVITVFIPSQIYSFSTLEQLTDFQQKDAGGFKVGEAMLPVMDFELANDPLSPTQRDSIYWQTSSDPEPYVEDYGEFNQPFPPFIQSI